MSSIFGRVAANKVEGLAPGIGYHPEPLNTCFISPRSRYSLITHTRSIRFSPFLHSRLVIMA